MPQVLPTCGTQRQFTSATVGGVTYNYITQNGQVVRQTWTSGGTSHVMDFIYDNTGKPYALKYDGTTYYYVLNLQGDVMSIITHWGESYGSYTYDAWGNVLSVSGDIANLNPIRYRGYYYDSETRLYYLQSRYYDPQVKRFINADGFASTGQGFIGYNMFVYSNNSPVNFDDATGDMPTWVYKYFGTVWNYYSFVCNYGDSDVPYYGPPNGYAKSPNGIKERWYGNDGKPRIDKHNTDHGNPKKHPDVPHGHDWGMDENGNWRPGEGYPWDESKDNNAKAEVVEKVVAGAFLAYTVIKWIVAISTAGPTGGASLAGAAAMP